MSDNTKITTDTFNEYLKNNYSNNLVINIGKTPNQPTIDKITIDNNTIHVEMVTIDNDPKHYEYNYELKNEQTNQIRTGVTENIHQKLVIKQIQSDALCSIRINIFNQVAHSPWSSWKHPSFKVNIIDKTDEDNLSEIQLQRYLLPSDTIGQVKTIYLEQIKDDKTDINDLLFFNDNNTDEKDVMNNNKTLQHYDICKQQNTKIFAEFANKMCTICYLTIKRNKLIELECCGLQLHNDCLQAFIESKSIIPGQKISLNQLSCLICKNQMKNESAKHLFASIDILYNKLSNIALNQLKYDNMSNHKQIIDKNGEFYKNPRGFAM
eukprot:376269_1